MGRTPTLVLCSRNARPEKGLVRRPHLTNMGAFLVRKSKRAWREHYKACSFDAHIRGSTRLLLRK